MYTCITHNLSACSPTSLLSSFHLFNIVASSTVPSISSCIIIRLNFLPFSISIICGLGDDPLPGYSTRSTLSLDPLNLFPFTSAHETPLPASLPRSFIYYSIFVLTALRCGGGCRASVRHSPPVSHSFFSQLWSLRCSNQMPMTLYLASLCH